MSDRPEVVSAVARGRIASASLSSSRVNIFIINLAIGDLTVLTCTMTTEVRRLFTYLLTYYLLVSFTTTTNNNNKTEKYSTLSSALASSVPQL